MRHKIEGRQGNCSPQDETIILDNIEDQCIINDTQIGIPNIALARVYNLDTIPSSAEWDGDCPDVLPNIELSGYKEAAISYIAGFVAKKVGCPVYVQML